MAVTASPWFWISRTFTATLSRSPLLIRPVVRAPATFATGFNSSRNAYASVSAASRPHLQQRHARSLPPRRIAAQCTRWASQVGAEPGSGSLPADYNKSSKFQSTGESDSDIRIVDYSDKDVQQHTVSTANLKSFLENNEKPTWASCRWIYANGLNEEVVKTIGHAKGLHRLAIEDVLDTTTSAKVYWYESHCFMELPMQKLVHRQQNDRTAAQADVVLQDAPHRRIVSRDLALSIEQVSIFLTADNTVVTFFENSGGDILRPILTRLNEEQTLIRSTNDPWMLVQAVIDTVVDLSLPIGNAVDEVYGNLERAVLTSPAIAQSKEVYVLRSGLTVLLNNTNSANGLVKTLIDHREMIASKAPNAMHMSVGAQVYFQDVQDHLTTLSNNTHMSIRSAENLTSLIFNMIAASQNESVRQLTLISSFFLPLTFLTGYFGMNFASMPIVTDHSDAYFWIIATPIMVTTLFVLGVRSSWFRSFVWRRRHPSPRPRR